MQPGKSTIQRPRIAGFPPTVMVGADDRNIWVNFGTVNILLANSGDGTTIVVRGEARDIRGNSLPLELRAATDVRNQVEYHLQEVPATPD